MRLRKESLVSSIVCTFYDLGEDVRKRWEKSSYSEDAFVKIAEDCLQKAKLHTFISPADIINLSLANDPSLSAHQVDSPFGDLQLVAYRHPKFYIEILYWCDGSTSVHDHGFSGAFTVASGSSLNLEFIFKEEERINHHFCLGELFSSEFTKLHPGDVKPIYSGRQFIHSVFHLDNPTVSVVIRTVQDDDSMPQYDYRGSHVRLVESLVPAFTKRIQGLRFLYQSHEKSFLKEFTKIFKTSSLDERYWLYRAFYKSLDAIPEKSEFLSIEDKNTNLIKKTVEEEAALFAILKLRASTSDKDLRYFYALLLTLPRWSDILDFTRQFDSSRDANLIYDCLNKVETLGYKLPNSPKVLSQISDDYNSYLESDTPPQNDNVISMAITNKILKQA